MSLQRRLQFYQGNACFVETSLTTLSWILITRYQIPPSTEMSVSSSTSQRLLVLGSSNSGTTVGRHCSLNFGVWGRQFWASRGLWSFQKLQRFQSRFLPLKSIINYEISMSSPSVSIKTSVLFIAIRAGHCSNKCLCHAKPLFASNKHLRE